MHGRRVLVIDDDSGIAELIKDILTEAGATVDAELSAEEGLRLFRTRRYDLVLLDVKMPQVGGRELKKIIEKKLPGIKTIYLTGHGSEEDYQAGSAEAEYYLMKPININDLIKKINDALKK